MKGNVVCQRGKEIVNGGGVDAGSSGRYRPIAPLGLLATLGLLALVSAVGCSPAGGVESIVQLEEGILALEEGRYVEAKERCSLAARKDPSNHSALRCWLAAGVAAGDWSSAHEAALAGAKGGAEAGWFGAVALELARRSTGESQSLFPKTIELAWACAGGGCLPAEPNEGAVPEESRLSAALCLLADDQWEEASGYLESSCGDSERCRELWLVTLLGTGRMDRAWDWVRLGGVGDAGERSVAGTLGQFFRGGVGAPPTPPGTCSPTTQKAIEFFELAAQLPPGNALRVGHLESALAILPKFDVARVMLAKELILQGRLSYALSVIPKTGSGGGWYALLRAMASALAGARGISRPAVTQSVNEVPAAWEGWFRAVLR